MHIPMMSLLMSLMILRGYLCKILGMFATRVHNRSNNDVFP